jgi:iron complex transport system substrate-binding protein
MAPNLELIVSLKPDLVVMSNNPRVSRRLEQLGLKVFVIDTVNHSDVHRLFEKLDEIFKTNEGQRVWQSMNASIDQAADSLPKSAQQLRVYFEVSTGPYAAGESSFIGETLTRLGVKNIVLKSLGDFPKLNPEFVVKQNPDLIIVSDNRISDLTQRPGWGQMSAIRNQHVCTLTPEQSDIVVRPGPRMGEGAQIIAQCILNKGRSP